MKTRSILLSFMLLVGLIGFNSCEKDSADPLTQEEAQQQLAGVSSDYSTYNEDAQNTTGMNAYYSVDDLNVGFSLFDFGGSEMGKSVSNFKALDLKNLSSKDVKKINYYIDFEDNVGTYTWNGYSFDYSSTPSDEIVINFPYNSTTNNATLRYYDYTSDLYGDMTGLKGELKYNGTVVLSFTYSFDYALSSSNVNISENLNLTIGEYNMVDEYTINSGDSKMVMSASTLFKKNGSVVYKRSLDATYASNSDQSADVIISAKFTVGTIEFRATYNFNTQDLYTDTTFDPNNYVKMSIYTTSGAKVGDFKFEYELTEYNYNEWVLYFYYNNGEKVKASELLGELGSDLYWLIWDNFYNDFKK